MNRKPAVAYFDDDGNLTRIDILQKYIPPGSAIQIAKEGGIKDEDKEIPHVTIDVHSTSTKHSSKIG